MVQRVYFFVVAVLALLVILFRLHGITPAADYTFTAIIVSVLAILVFRDQKGKSARRVTFSKNQIVVFLLFVTASWLINVGYDALEPAQGVLLNLATELLGALVPVVLVAWLLKEEENRDNAEQEQIQRLEAAIARQTALLTELQQAITTRAATPLSNEESVVPAVQPDPPSVKTSSP